jgi:HSP20 family protein
MITRWNPIREMSAMQRLMDRMFEDWRPLVDENGGVTAARALALDVDEDETTYTITTEMPGVQVDHIQVRQEGDYLLIEGEIPEQESERKDKRTLIKERHYGRYSRRLRLPQNVNFEKADAHYENGVLTLTLPKAEVPQPKLITVKAGKQ